MRRRNREVSIFNMSTIDLFACAMGAFILLTLILLPYYLKVDRSYLDLIEQLKEELSEAQSQIMASNESLAQCDTQLVQINSELQDTQQQLLIIGSDFQDTQRSLQRELQDTQERLLIVSSDFEDTQRALQLAIESEKKQVAELQICNNIAKRNFILVLMSWQSEDDIDLHVVDSSNNRYYYEQRGNTGSVASFEEDNVRGPGNEIWLHPSAEPGEYKVYYSYYRKRTAATVAVRGTVFHQQGKFTLPEANLSEVLGDDFNSAPLIATIVVDANGTVSIR